MIPINCISSESSWWLLSYSIHKAREPFFQPMGGGQSVNTDRGSHTWEGQPDHTGAVTPGRGSQTTQGQSHLGRAVRPHRGSRIWEGQSDHTGAVTPRRGSQTTQGQSVTPGKGSQTTQGSHTWEGQLDHTGAVTPGKGSQTTQGQSHLGRAVGPHRGSTCMDTKPARWTLDTQDTGCILMPPPPQNLAVRGQSFLPTNHNMSYLWIIKGVLLSTTKQIPWLPTPTQTENILLLAPGRYDCKVPGILERNVRMLTRTQWHWRKTCKIKSSVIQMSARLILEVVSQEGAFYDIVIVPSGTGDMELFWITN